MKIITPSVEIISPISKDGAAELALIELIGRGCYHSEDRITPDGESARKFVANLIKNGHESVLEHVSISVKIICDRGITHELVRHRHTAYTQESTRYCDYSDEEKYPEGLVVIKPCWLNFDSEDEVEKERISDWVDAVDDAFFWYKELMSQGCKPEEARGLLPHCTASTLYMTANLREWRHILKLRTGKDAHPQMREVAGMILSKFQSRIPIIFDGIGEGGNE